jgi:hypothetical protein
MSSNTSTPRDDDSKNLTIAERRRRVIEFLETDVWPTIPPEYRGRMPTRAEEDEVLGYGSQSADPSERLRRQ